MALPVNLTAATAIALTASGTVTQRVDDAGVTYEVWYKYVNVSGVDQVISLWHTGDPVHFHTSTGYRPFSNIWLDEAASINVIGQYTNGSTTIPCPAGYSYWINIENETLAWAGPSMLTLGFLISPTITSATEGQLLVPSASMMSWFIDDVGWTGLQAGVIDPATQTIVGFVAQFPTGEAGDMLPAAGRILMVDEPGSVDGYPTPNPTFGYWFHVYDSSFAHVAQVGVESNQVPPFARTHLPSDTAYVMGQNSGGHVQYRTIGPTGAASAVTPISSAQLGGAFYSLAVNNAATVMYQGVGYPSTVLRRWDLGGLTYLSNLAAAVPGYVIPDMLVLPDDSIVALYFKYGSPRGVSVRRYDPSGTLLNTYPLTFSAEPTSVDPRLAYDTDPDAFWVFTHLDSAYSDIRKIRTDGTEVSASLTPDVYQSDRQQLNPPVPYTSDSCPLLRLFGASDPEPPEPPSSAHLEARYIRRLRRAPHIANEHKRVFYRSFELDLERGQALATGQGSDPVVLLRISRDGGQTWGEEIRMAVGQMGEYQARVLARRLGHSRDTVFEIVVSDPISWSIVDAWLELEPGTS